MRKLNVIKRSTALIFIALLTVVSGTTISWRAANNDNFKLDKDSTSLVSNEALSTEKLFNDYAFSLYKEASLDLYGLNEDVFFKAITGYYNLKNDLSNNKSIITIVDLAKSSRDKRMWVIDLENKKVLSNNLVSHGQGSGDDMANQFSDTENSHQSSLGFYITGEIYYGKHGRSLRLDGKDEGFNASARARDIVLHGASYVSDEFIKGQGRLGRSFGCPAVPVELTDKIIDLVKGKTLLFINGANDQYNSKYLDKQNAFQFSGISMVSR